MNQLTKFFEKNGLLILGVFCLLPFLLLSYFVHPVGTHGWDWATQYSGGQLPPNLSYWAEQKYWYTNIMGRYASTGLLSLTRFWFNITTFKIFPFVSILIIFSSLHYLLKSIFGNHSVKKTLLISIAVSLIYLDQLAGVYEAFYNLSCVLTYQFGGICFFLLAGLMLRILNQSQKKSPLNIFLIGVLVFLAVGSNEVTLIATNGWLSLLLIGGYFYHKKWQPWILGLFIFALACSFFEILAPGNFVRMDLSSNARRPMLTIFLTLSVSFFNWMRWFSSTPLLIFAVLYLPAGIHFAKNNQNSTFFKYHLFATLGFFSFQWLTLALLFWSVGDEALPERLMDLIFLICLPLMAYILQCLIFIFLEKKWLSPTLSFPKFATWSLFFFITLHLFFSGLKIDKSEEARTTSNYLSIVQTNSNIGQAWLEILNGNAATYNEEQFEIYETIKNAPPSDTLFISPLQISPKLIYDKTYDRKAKLGEPFMSHYFGKDCIIIYEK